MFDLASHPIGIKYYTGFWARNKGLTLAEAQKKMSETFYMWSHRRFGSYYFLHRAGRGGMKAPIVVLGLSGKLFSMAYATYRDQEAAIQCSAAYGQGGIMAASTK